MFGIARVSLGLEGKDDMAIHVNRRTMLRGMGAALALPWMESLAAAGQAVAGSARPPVRMCYWYVPNGVHLPTWFPDHEGTLVDLPETLQPLAFASRSIAFMV